MKLTESQSSQTSQDDDTGKDRMAEGAPRTQATEDQTLFVAGQAGAMGHERWGGSCSREEVGAQAKNGHCQLGGPGPFAPADTPSQSHVQADKGSPQRMCPENKPSPQPRRGTQRTPVLFHRPFHRCPIPASSQQHLLRECNSVLRKSQFPFQNAHTPAQLTEHNIRGPKATGEVSPCLRPSCKCGRPQQPCF